jgi:uncharacterized membrane protein
MNQKDKKILWIVVGSIWVVAIIVFVLIQKFTGLFDLEVISGFLAQLDSLTAEDWGRISAPLILIYIGYLLAKPKKKKIEKNNPREISNFENEDRDTAKFIEEKRKEGLDDKDISKLLVKQGCAEDIIKRLESDKLLKKRNKNEKKNN